MEETTVTSATPQTISELYSQVCPLYMAMGMSRDEFYHGETWAVYHYREADLLRRKHYNYEAWLHNTYTYEAVGLAISNALRGKGKQPQPWLKEPYDIYEEQNSVDEEKIAEAEKAKAMIAQDAFIRRFAHLQKAGEDNGDGT